MLSYLVPLLQFHGDGDRFAQRRLGRRGGGHERRQLGKQHRREKEHSPGGAQGS